MISSIRVVLAVGAVLGAIFAPPWVPLLLIVLLALRFQAWEVPLIGMLMDFLWLPGTFFFPVPLFTIAAILIVFGLKPLRSELFV